MSYIEGIAIIGFFTTLFATITIAYCKHKTENTKRIKMSLLYMDKNVSSEKEHKEFVKIMKQFD